MITFLMVLSILLVLFSAFVCWQVLEQRKVIAQMMENDDIADSEQQPEMVITLRVLDPIALAKRESRSAACLPTNSRDGPQNGVPGSAKRARKRNGRA